MLRTRKAWLSGLPDVLQNLKFMFITGNLITMLGSLKNTTFSTPVHRASDLIKEQNLKLQTLDCWAHYVTLTLSEEMMLDRSINGSGEKIPFDPEHRN